MEGSGLRPVPFLTPFSEPLRLDLSIFRQILLRVLPPSMMALATVGLVHDLTNNTFRSFLAENNMVLIGFVLPFLPTYQRFSQEFEEVYIMAVYGNAREADCRAIHRQLERRLTLEFNSPRLTAKPRPRCAESLSSSAGQQSSCSVALTMSSCTMEHGKHQSSYQLWYS